MLSDFFFSSFQSFWIIFFLGGYTGLFKIRTNLRYSILDTAPHYNWDASAHWLCNFKPKQSLRQYERLHVNCNQTNSLVVHISFYCALVIIAIPQEHLGVLLIYFLHGLHLTGSNAWLTRSPRCVLQYQDLWTWGERGIYNLIDKYFTHPHLLHSSPCILE